jgi:hypothetical protein
MRPAHTLCDYSPARQLADAEYVKAIRNGMDPERVAATILRVARAKHPRPRYRVGGQSRLTSVLKNVLPARVFEFGVRTVLGRKLRLEGGTT